MIPSFVTLVIAILFVVPGYYLLSRLGISKRLTDLQLVLRGMPLSLFLHMIYTLPLLWFNQVRIVEVLKGISRLQGQQKTFSRAPDEYFALFAPHLRPLILAVVGLVFVTILVTMVVQKVLARFAVGMEDRTERTMLHELLWAYHKRDARPVVQITFKNGTTYWGIVVKGSYELTEEILLHPYSILTENGPEEHFDDYLYLKLSEAAEIQFFDTNDVLEAHISLGESTKKNG